MNRKAITVLSLITYSLVLVLSSFFVGKITKDTGTESVISSAKAEEEYYTAKESGGKLSVYKDGQLLISLDTNIETLPSVVRSRLKHGINFKAGELPEILEAFAE